MILLFLGSAMAGCNITKSAGENGQLELNGMLNKPGMTTYQYGTHVLKGADKSYALKSTAVDLDEFVGKQVKITGKKVEGYPVENGPDLIDVLKISVTGKE